MSGFQGNKASGAKGSGLKRLLLLSLEEMLEVNGLTVKLVDSFVSNVGYCAILAGSQS